MSAVARIAAKAMVLLAGWLVAMLPPLSAVLLWKSYGGTSIRPSWRAGVGHMLNAGLTIALAAATASLTEHPSTAAILTLGVTVGTWIINSSRAVQGGWWERAAGYTPAGDGRRIPAWARAARHRARSRLSLVLAGLALAAIWMRLGIAVRAARRTNRRRSGALAAIAIFACTFVTPSWDSPRTGATRSPKPTSTRSADPPAAAHRSRTSRRRIRAALDLEHHALSKLRRVMPNLQVHYVSATSIGLFEQTSAGYGEIWYDSAAADDEPRHHRRGRARDDLLRSPASPRPRRRRRSLPRPSARRAADRARRRIFYGVWPALDAGRRNSGTKEIEMKTTRSDVASRFWPALVSARPTSRWISARSRSANRPPPSSRWSERGWSRRTAPKSHHGRRPAVGREQGQSDEAAAADRAQAVRHDERRADGQREAVRLLPGGGAEGRRQLLERHHQHEVQDRRRRLRPLLRHSLQREAERRLAGRPLQRHREQRRALGVPQRHPPEHEVQRSRQAVHARPRRLA